MFVPTSGGYSSRIRDNTVISLGMEGLFPKLSVVSEPLIVLFSDTVGVLLIFWMVKSVCLEKYWEIF